MIGQQPQNAAGLPPLAIPWDIGGGSAPADAAARHTWPPADWPTTSQLTYTRELITVVLLLIAFPFILHRLARRPRATAAALAGKAL